MLSKEKIENLNNKIKEGNNAEKLLDEYNDLIDQKECLEKVKKLGINCRKINFEYAYNSNIEFKVNLSNFALEQIHKILDNEIEFLNNKIDEFE